MNDGVTIEKFSSFDNSITLEHFLVESCYKEWIINGHEFFKKEEWKQWHRMILLSEIVVDLVHECVLKNNSCHGDPSFFSVDYSLDAGFVPFTPRWVHADMHAMQIMSFDLRSNLLY